MRKFSLNPDRVKYSPGEQRLFSLLTGKKQNTKALVLDFYTSEEPFNARNAVIDSLRKLSRKATINREAWRIKCSKRSGPTPMDFWLEEK